MALQQISLSSAGSFTVAVICLMFFGFQGWLYLRKREEIHNGWGALISLSTCVYSIGVFIQFNTIEGPLNHHAEDIQFSGIALLIYSMYGFTLPFYGRHPRHFHTVAGPMTLVVLVLIWSTDLIISSSFVHRTFAWLGKPYIEPNLGPLGPVFLCGAALAVLGPVWFWLRQPKSNDRGGNIMIMALGFWAILGAHDALATLGMPTVQFLMEYGSLAFSAAVLSLTIREHLRLHGEIDARDERLAEERLRLSTTLRSMAEAFIAADNDGRIILVNPAAERLSGWSAEDAAGQPVELVLRRCHQGFPAPESAPKMAKRPLHLSGTFVTPKGDERHVVQTQSPLHDRRGDEIGQIYVLRDETERKQMRQQLERSKRMEALGVLAGGVAHDLSNLLAGLVTYPDALLMQLPKGHHLRSAVTTIKESGERAAALVRDLLTMARGNVATLEPVDITSLVAEVAQGPEIRSLRRNHPQLEIDFDLGRSLPKVMGSRYRLAQVVANLVTNAAEAAPGGRVGITTSQRQLDQSLMGYEQIPAGNYATIAVVDDGTGIATEDLEKIFEPFFTSKEMGHSGTGLGMAVVYGAVKDHDGFIDVKSRTGEGTTFTIFLPVFPRKATSASSESHGDEKAGEPTDTSVPSENAHR